MPLRKARKAVAYGFSTETAMAWVQRITEDALVSTAGLEEVDEQELMVSKAVGSSAKLVSFRVFGFISLCLVLKGVDGALIE
jgi:hypothetical protein